MKRRTFIKNSGIAGIGGLVAIQCKAKSMGHKLDDFGVQLWSVRDDMKRDPVATLKALAGIGYKDIECGGGDHKEGIFYGFERDEFKKIITDMGLSIRSGHIITGRLVPDQKRTMNNDFEALCQDFASLGARSIICGYLDKTERISIDDYKRFAELLNKCGEMAKSYGLMLGHHNHDFEFLPMDGEIPYDVLLNGTDKSLVRFEMDLYWITKANVEYKKYFETHPGRFPIWHVKDMDNTSERFFTEVGNGIIDWKEVFEYKELSGMEYFYVEQDEHRTYPPIKSMEVSHDYLAKLEV